MASITCPSRRTAWSGLKRTRGFAGANGVVVEGLNLAGVPPGEYTLVCLPLKLKGADGAPARAVLLGE